MHNKKTITGLLVICILLFTALGLKAISNSSDGNGNLESNASSNASTSNPNEGLQTIDEVWTTPPSNKEGLDPGQEDDALNEAGPTTGEEVTDLKEGASNLKEGAQKDGNESIANKEGIQTKTNKNKDDEDANAKKTYSPVPDVKNRKKTKQSPNPTVTPKKPNKSSKQTKSSNQTEPIHAGEPTNPSNANADAAAPTPTKKPATCSLFIGCSNILNNMEGLKKGKENYIPANGVIYKKSDLAFQEGESVYDVLKREMKENGIPLVHNKSPFLDTYYIEGIGNIFEFDCGPKSGWIYRVNGVYQNVGCSEYVVKDGDMISFDYTCNSGEDVK